MRICTSPKARMQYPVEWELEQMLMPMAKDLSATSMMIPMMVSMTTKLPPTLPTLLGLGNLPSRAVNGMGNPALLGGSRTPLPSSQKSPYFIIVVVVWSGGSFSSSSSWKQLKMRHRHDARALMPFLRTDRRTALQTIPPPLPSLPTSCAATPVVMGPEIGARVSTGSSFLSCLWLAPPPVGPLAMLGDQPRKICAKDNAQFFRLTFLG